MRVTIMPMHERKEVHISTATMIRFFAIILSLVAIYFIRDIIASLLFAVIIASALEPAINWLKARRIPRIFGVLIIYMGITFGFFFLIYLVFPLILEDLRSVATLYPTLQNQALTEINRTGVLSFFPLLSSDTLKSVFDLPSEYIGKLGNGAFSVLASAFGGLFSFILVVVFSFYLAAQEKGIESFLRMVTPLSRESYIIDLWRRSQQKLGRWFQAQLLLGALVGVFIFFGLTLLGVPHPLLFALLSALFEIIPVVGPILAAVPAVGAAFLVSPLLGISALVLYVVVQQTESHVIVPLVMRKAIGLSPLIVVLALLVGAKIGGIFGILLAVPLATIFVELLNDWDKKKRSLMPE